MQLITVVGWAGADVQAASETNIGTSDNIIWYRQPAEDWVQALPVGNGRLGAMVFGKVKNEHIQLNDDSIFAGQPVNRNNPKALENLAEVRRLLFAGKPVEAQALAENTVIGIPRRLPPYQPLGDLWLRFSGHENFFDYRRELDLDSGIVTVTYRIGDAHFKREVFSTAMDQVIVIRLMCDKAGMISFSASMDREQDSETKAVAPDRVFLQGQALSHARQRRAYKGGTKFYAVLRAIPEGGQVNINGKQVEVENANAVTLIVAAETDYRSRNPAFTCERYLVSANRPYRELREAHVRDHQRLFRRVELELSDQNSSRELSRLPIDERIERFKNGRSDPQLMALFFQFGRYLLIASSRPGTLPANLQGLWNWKVDPPWESKYTTNCNVEINYWPAEVCNLSECHYPLFDLIKLMQESGRRTAKSTYGCRGFVAHHNTDIWGHTEPVDGARWGLWPMGGAWMCLHLWEHYKFTLDRDFLARDAYPLIKEAALFFVDYLVEDDNGQLVSGPSMSPENSYLTPNGEVGVLSMAPAMDTQIIRALFTSCIKASQILNTDTSFRQTLSSMLQRLPDHKIGKYGQLQEWYEDYEENEPYHRHISHLFAIFPGEQITPEYTPELAKAVRCSLERREAEGRGTGWAAARFWYACCWARLNRADRAYETLEYFLKRAQNGALFALGGGNHQLDNNFAGTAAIAEMLLQSHNGEIKLLPALPKAWSTGLVKGLRARGGFEIDMTWDKASLTKAIIKSVHGKTCRLRSDIPLTIKSQGKIIEVKKIEKNLIEFDTRPGQHTLLVKK